MNWEAIGAISEIVASFGVIISLIYLGIQIRNQTVETKLATGNELANQLNTVYANLSENSELAALFYQGINDFDSLNPEQKVQLSSYLNRLLRVVEAMFYQHQRGRLETTIWSGLDQAMRDICRYPGMKAWWLTREHWFSSEFRVHLTTYIGSREKPSSFGEM